MNKKAGKEGTSQEVTPGMKVENIRIKESEDLKKRSLKILGKGKTRKVTQEKELEHSQRAGKYLTF